MTILRWTENLTGLAPCTGTDQSESGSWVLWRKETQRSLNKTRGGSRIMFREGCRAQDSSGRCNPQNQIKKAFRGYKGWPPEPLPWIPLKTLEARKRSTKQLYAHTKSKHGRARIRVALLRGESTHLYIKTTETNKKKFVTQKKNGPYTDMLSFYVYRERRGGVCNNWCSSSLTARFCCFQNHVDLHLLESEYQDEIKWTCSRKQR